MKYVFTYEHGMGHIVSSKVNNIGVNILTVEFNRCTKQYAECAVLTFKSLYDVFKYMINDLIINGADIKSACKIIINKGCGVHITTKRSAVSKVKKDLEALYSNQSKGISL